MQDNEKVWTSDQTSDRHKLSRFAETLGQTMPSYVWVTF